MALEPTTSFRGCLRRVAGVVFWSKRVFSGTLGNEERVERGLALLSGDLGDSTLWVWVSVCGFRVGQAGVVPPLRFSCLVGRTGLGVVRLCCTAGNAGVTVVFTFGIIGFAGGLSCSFVVLGLLLIFSVGHDTYTTLVRDVMPGHRVVGKGTGARGGGVGSLGVMAALGTTGGSVVGSLGVMVAAGTTGGSVVGSLGAMAAAGTTEGSVSHF